MSSVLILASAMFNKIFHSFCISTDYTSSINFRRKCTEFCTWFSYRNIVSCGNLFMNPNNRLPNKIAWLYFTLNGKIDKIQYNMIDLFRTHFSISCRQIPFIYKYWPRKNITMKLADFNYNCRGKSINILRVFLFKKYLML